MAPRGAPCRCLLTLQLSVPVIGGAGRADVCGPLGTLRASLRLRPVPRVGKERGEPYGRSQASVTTMATSPPPVRPYTRCTLRPAASAIRTTDDMPHAPSMWTRVTGLSLVMP